MVTQPVGLPRRGVGEVPAVQGLHRRHRRGETGLARRGPGGDLVLVAEAAERCELASQRIPSGAGHDTQAIAAITDVAMLFVPSVNGISHSPEEFTTPEDCANGAQVLLNVLLLADERL